MSQLNLKQSIYSNNLKNKSNKLVFGSVNWIWISHPPFWFMQGFLTLYGRAQSSLHTVLQHTKRIPSSNGAFGLLMRNKNSDSKSHGRENATFRPALQSWLKLVSFCNMNNCRVVQRSIPGENRAVRWLHDLVKAAVKCMRSPWPFQKERTPGNGTSAAI